MTRLSTGSPIKAAPGVVGKLDNALRRLAVAPNNALIQMAFQNLACAVLGEFESCFQSPGGSMFLMKCLWAAVRLFPFIWASADDAASTTKRRVPEPGSLALKCPALAGPDLITRPRA